MTLSRIKTKLLITALTLATLFGCTSRYRLDFFMVQGENREKVKIEKTEYALGAVLADPMSPDKVRPGDGNTLILITGSRGSTVGTKAEDLVTFDRYIRYRLFVQLPSVVKPAAVELEGNSFVQLLGHYDRPAEDKMYLPRRGELQIDSLANERIFGTLKGDFENRLGETVGFEGQFKARIED